MRVGIVGANGFIGRRALEMLPELGYTVRGIVRSPDQLQALQAQDIDGALANALDQQSLESAFAGCDVILHSVLGSPGLIRGATKPLYRAAQRAGVNRIIYLSTMCVHTQAPSPGTTEDSAFVSGQPFPYNSAKIDAERQLLACRSTGNVEVVIFRPGIVFGPCSRWITDLAQSLTDGSVYLVQDGQSICNTTYVDNLIHAIHLAIPSSAADQQAFFVGEHEIVTWSDFYRPFAIAFGVDPNNIPRLESPTFKAAPLPKRLRASLQDSVMTQTILARIDNDWKKKLKTLLGKRSPTSAPSIPSAVSEVPQHRKPIVSREMAALQQCCYKLPLKKAQSILGYEPLYPFQDACQRTLQWLAQNGYPHLQI
jgi:2-alkyl-3-oxoalkanoate reductase